MNSQILLVGNYSWHTGSRTLVACNDKSSNITLSNLQFKLLKCLAEAHPRIVTHDEILAYVWRSRPASSECLSQLISRTRNLLQDKDKNILVNLPGEGYTLTFSTFDTAPNVIPDQPAIDDAPIQAPSCKPLPKALSKNDRLCLVAIGGMSAMLLIFTLKISETLYYKHIFNTILHAEPYPHILDEKVDGKTTLLIDQFTCVYEPCLQRLRCQ